MKIKSYLLFFTLLILLVSGCVKKNKNEQYLGKEAKNNIEILKQLVHVTAAGISGISHNSSSDIDTALIKKYLSKIRFWKDKSGYFFVVDFTNNHIIANPVDTNLVGKDGTDIRDSKGDYYIRLMSVKAKGGGGYADYYMKNPVTHKNELKESYVEKIPGTNFYLGAGQYIGSNNYPRSR